MGTKMRPFTVYSFYTEDTPYKDVVEKYLLPSVEKFKDKFETKILVAQNYHHWKKNVSQKPLMILNLLNDNKDCIVFTDADSTIERYPQLFHEIPDDYDIAFHTLDWNSWYRNKSNVKELLSGTMFFRNRQIIKDLCAEWYDKAQDGNCWEQKILENIISKYPLKIYPLPIEYIYIDTLPRGGKPYIQCDNVVIRHHQISRILKHRGNL